MKESITMERTSQRESTSNSYPFLRSRSLRDGRNAGPLYEGRPLYKGPGLLQRQISWPSVATPHVISAFSTPRLRRSPSSHLTINQPRDPFEEEADRVSDQVMRMPGTAVVQRRCPSCEQDNDEEQPGVVQRKCTACAEEERTFLQRFDAEPSSRIHSDVAPPIVHDVLRSPGQPLDRVTRSFMEPRFGFDFSGIRVHTDGRAAESARAVNALAYTVGNNIVFGAGQHAPNTAHGARLMAHELTHVVQQGGGAPALTAATVNHAPSAPAQLQRQFGPIGITGELAKDLIGVVWLNLSRRNKERLINRAIDSAILVIDKFPGRIAIGDLWPLMEAGLHGFYERLKSAAIDIKIRAMDKIATIMAGQDQQFSLAFAKGLLKGFFIDGILGIFIAIWDLGSGLIKFIQQIKEAIESPEILAKLAHFQVILWDFVNGQSALNEIWKLVKDPKQLAELAAIISQQAKNFAKQAGSSIADSLLEFFSQESASAEIGSAVGDIVGMTLWEVLFAVFTAGGGAVADLVKEGAELVAKAAQSILKMAEKLLFIFRKAIEGIKVAIRFVKGKLVLLGKRVEEIFGEIGEFFELLLRSCHESKLKCKFPAESTVTKEAKAAEKVAEAKIGTEIKAGAKEAEEAQQAGQSALARRSELAKDPAHAGNISAKTLREADVGLDLERQGRLKPPIRRDPNPAGAEFIDGDGIKWDIKRFNSKFPAKRGGFTLKGSMDAIERELAKGENVIVDTIDMSVQHVADLRNAVHGSGIGSKVIFYPH